MSVCSNGLDKPLELMLESSSIPVEVPISKLYATAWTSGSYAGEIVILTVLFRQHA